MHVRPLVLVLATTAACSTPAGQRTPAASSTPRPVAAEHIPQSQAVARADALLEDLKRRETAQANFERQPRPALVAIPSLAASDSPPPTAPAVVPGPATGTPAADQPPPIPPTGDPSRDETWWRQQRQSLQQVLDNELAKLAEADKLNLKNGYDGAQAIYKQRVEAVAAARLAIDKLYDDARRAGVPPAWLR